MFSSSFYQWVVFFVNLLTQKLWVQRHEIPCLLEIQTSLKLFSLHKIEMSKQHISLTNEGNVNH